MAVMAYNDQLRSLLANVECVLALDTAADFLGLTNGGYRGVAQIFVNKPIRVSFKGDLKPQQKLAAQRAIIGEP